ncbi:MAG: adenylyltransferase/cytidyltransferase family protein [Chloroflexota bacterium]
MVQTELWSKVKTLDELAHIISGLKREGKVVVQCHGVFDLLHPGHIRHFDAAKQEGDVLVVTITKDAYVDKGPGRPIFNERLRAESIAALGCVDYVAINEWPTAVETIKKLKPDVYAKGSDYADAKDDLTGKISDEEAAVKSVGGRIHFTGEITFSSTKLLNLHFDVFPEEARHFLRKFRSRYSAKDIINRIEALKKMKVLVIGDAIIDEYHYCIPLGKSPKEILIPAKYLYQESFAGGILAVANHVAGFCDKVDVVTCLGMQNTCEDFIS